MQSVQLNKNALHLFLDSFHFCYLLSYLHWHFPWLRTRTYHVRVSSVLNIYCTTARMRPLYEKTKRHMQPEKFRASLLIRYRDILLRAYLANEDQSMTFYYLALCCSVFGKMSGFPITSYCYGLSCIKPKCGIKFLLQVHFKQLPSLHCLWQLYTLDRFSAFFQKGVNLFEHGSTLKEKNASKRTKFFCYSVNPFSEGDKNIFDIVTCSESVSIPLTYISH